MDWNDIKLPAVRKPPSSFFDSLPAVHPLDLTKEGWYWKGDNFCRPDGSIAMTVIKQYPPCQDLSSTTPKI